MFNNGSSPTRMYVALCMKKKGDGYEPITFYLPDEPAFTRNTADDAALYFQQRLDPTRGVALCVTLEDWNSKHAWAVKSPPAKPVEEEDDAEYEYIFRASYDPEAEDRADGFHVGLDEIQEGNRKAAWHGKEIGKLVDYYKIVHDDDEEVVTIFYHYKDAPKKNLLGDLPGDMEYLNTLYEIRFGSYRDANTVLEALLKEIQDHDYATVGDFYEACGMDSSMRDQNFGWYNLSGASISRVANSKTNEYWIEFPLVLPILPKKQLSGIKFDGRGRFA